MSKKLILASSSPRRLMLLQAAGFEVQQLSPDMEEIIEPHESARIAAERLSREKALNIGFRELPVIAADTIVLIDDIILGKPTDYADATAMLKRLAGKWHEVWTGFSVAFKGNVHTQSVCTRVKFRPYTSEDIALYLENEKPYDKSGSYAIQNSGCSLIDRIEGSITNIVGLPLAELLVLINGLDLHGPE